MKRILPQFVNKSGLNSLTLRIPKQFEVATFAVYVLGGAARAIDTEDAAMKCHELAPALFSWQKYKDQINLELVRVSLSDAKKPKNGGLLSGSGREGWRLTSSGIDWVADTGQALLASQLMDPGRGHSNAGSIDAVRRQRERTRLLASAGWQSWSSTGTVDQQAAREVFRIDEYTTKKMLAIKITRKSAMFETDEQLSPFVLAAARLLLEEKTDGK